MPAPEVWVLTELLVRDLGVIDELSLVLDGGMTVVTGETGAGKTLIVGAIDLSPVVGPARRSCVRVRPRPRFKADSSSATTNSRPSGHLARGRSRVYINGHLATVSALAEQGVDLIDLHGQHAHQSLLKTAVQRSALDRFGGIDTAPLASVLDELRAAESSLAELGGDERARARESTFFVTRSPRSTRRASRIPTRIDASTTKRASLPMRPPIETLRAPPSRCSTPTAQPPRPFLPRLLRSTAVRPSPISPAGSRG